MKNILASAADLIARFEGFVAQPYWDYRQWSVGYGMGVGYDKNVKPDIVVTKEQALEDLKGRLEKDYKEINAALKVNITDSQTVALLSFNYNLGFGNTKNIINRINKGMNDAEVTTAMGLYIYAGGAVNAGLRNRRHQEIQVYLS